MGQTQPSDDEGTGLPLLKSWRAVHAFVAIAFGLYVIALTFLSHLKP